MKAKADKSAEVFIYEDVGESWMGGVTAKQFAADLKALGKVDSIDVRINSNGGDVFDGVAIHRQLMDHGAHIKVHIDGIAASVASVIAMAGDEIIMTEAGQIMIHNASGMASGMSKDMRQLADILDKVSASIAGVYVGRTKQTLAQITAWMEKETWFNSAAALANGFVHTLAPNMKVTARLDNRRYNYKHVPAEILQAANSDKVRPLFTSKLDKLAIMKGEILQGRK